MAFVIPIGKDQPETGFSIPVTGTAEDVARSTAAGLRRGVEAIPGMAGDISQLGRAGIAKVAGWLGAEPETSKAITDYDIPWVPDVTTENIHAATTPLLGKSYEPQTTAGKYARTAAEFAPAFVGNPLAGAGKFAGKLALGAGAGLASEAAGQATEGTAAEPYARAATGIAAGLTGHGLASRVEGAIREPGLIAERAAEDAARQHGVHLTKGQRSGNITQQATEEQLLRGTRGDLAQRMMQGRENANEGALQQATTSLGDRVAPTRGADPVQAGDLLNQSVRDRVDRLKTAGGQQINDALNSGVMVDADRLRGLTGDIGRNLAGNVPHVPDVVLGPNTPMANEAMSRLSTFAAQAQDPNVREFSLAGGEHLRRRINGLAAQPGTEDARALGRIRQHFDDWLEQSVQGGTSPDPAGPGAALADLQSGRATYREGARVERPRGNEKQQPGAKPISDLALTNHPEDTRRLFQPNDRGMLSPQATDAITRLTSTGATPGELDQVRGIVLDQLTTGGFPGRRATRIANFLDQNPTAAAALFSPAELENLRSLGTTNQRLVPDPRARNASGTSYPVVKEMAKGSAKTSANAAATIGALIGSWPAAAIAYGGSKAISALDRYVQGPRAAREALSPADRRTLATLMMQGGAKGAARAAVGAHAHKEEK